MAKIEDMTLDERETHLNPGAGDRQDGKDWEVVTDDVVMIRKFQGLGIDGKELEVGGAWKFMIPQNQITFRKKRVLTEEQRAELSRRARENFTRQDTARPELSSFSVGEEEDEEYVEEQDDDEVMTYGAP